MLTVRCFKSGCSPLMIPHWRKYLPPAPALPHSLWLTGSALLLALVSYGFQAELWPNHPNAGRWSLTLLSLLLMLGLLQVLNALRQWSAAIFGPVWWRLVFRVGVAVAQVGVALLIALVLLGGLIVLSTLS